MVLIGAFLAALPVGVAYVLEDMLRERGANSVVIDDIDINLFTGVADVYNVTAVDDTGRIQVDTLTIDVSMLSLLSGRVEILQLDLAGGHLDLIQSKDGAWQFGTLRIEGSDETAQPVVSEPAAPLALGAHRVTVEDFTVTLESAELVREFEIESLLVERAFSWQPQDPLQLDVTLRSGDAELDLSAQATPFDETLVLSGDLEFDNLLLQNIQNPRLAAALEKLAGRLDTDLAFNIRLAPEDSLEISLQGGLSLSDAAFADQGARIEFSEVEWRGDADTLISLSADPAPPTLAVTGALELANLSITGEADSFELVSVGAIELQNLNASALEASIENLAVTNLQARLERGASGAIRLPGGLAETSEAAPVSTTVPAPTTAPSGAVTPYAVRIDQLLLAGDNQLQIRDASVAPVFSANLVIEQLQLENIDTTGEVPLTLNLTARASDSSSLNIEGSLAPFAQQLSADLKVDIAGFDLSQFSAYVPGYNIERGRLALESTPKLVDNELDVLNKVTIDKLRIRGKDGEEDALVAAGAAMPLDVMLDLLRDSNDRIALEIPITGNIQSFDVGLGQVVRKASRAALQKAAMAYVKNALQPLGTILFAADLAGKAARPRFESIKFAPGDAALAPDQNEYTDKIAALLNKRPALGLTLCGIATQQDKAALAMVSTDNETTSRPAEPTQNTTPEVPEEDLLALAKARADAVRQRLREDGVNAEQLFECRSSFESAEDALPRVRVML